MKPRPDISILLLTWNRAPFLERCLRELFAALSPDVSREVIVMDNGSKDETVGIIGQYAARPDVRVVRNATNEGLEAYKKLFSLARGRLMIEVDDDVLAFPAAFDKTFLRYFKAYPDYGYLGLNVVQNGKTTGAKAPADRYREDRRGVFVVEEGPVGGWCSAFKRRHYLLFRPLLRFFKFSMRRGEDGTLMGFIQKVLRKRIGLIQNAVCFHATGPVYSQEARLIDRDIEKYRIGGLPDMAEKYDAFRREKENSLP